MQLFDKDGNEVNAFSEEEVKTKLDEQKVGFDTQITEKDQKIGGLNTEITTLKEKGTGDGKTTIKKEGDGGDDTTITAEELDAQIKKGVEEGLEKINAERKSTQEKSFNSRLDSLAGDDKELRARLDAEYKNLDGLDISMEDKMDRAASFIQTQSPEVKFSDTTVAPNGGIKLRHNSVDNPNNIGKVSDSVKNILKKTGTSDKDLANQVDKYESTLTETNKNN